MAYEKNNLLYDYGGFPEEMYRITWASNGLPSLAARAAELLNKVRFPFLKNCHSYIPYMIFLKNNIACRPIAQGRGLDHGVFIPFKLMFPDPLPIPLVEISIDRNLDPQHHINIGAALEPLRQDLRRGKEREVIQTQALCWRRTETRE